MNDRTESLMEAMEQGADFVSAMTGLKKMFVEQGWSERGAEGMVISILNKAGEGAS